MNTAWLFAGALLVAVLPMSAQQTVAPSASTQRSAADTPGDNRATLGDNLSDVVRAIDVPTIKLPVRAPLTSEDVARIKRHIANLALIDSPDMGLASTYGGSAFAPLPQATSVGTMILGSTRPKPSADLVELVKLGPKALPWLLAALDDPTPTELVIGHPLGAKARGFGGMYRANEIAGNPVNAVELAIIGPPSPRFDFGSQAAIKEERHIVTVGDVCFVIIGQITGRSSYRVARYQPSAITIINSPTDDPALVKQIRAIWSASDPEQHLLNSLLLDFSTTITLPETPSTEIRNQAHAVWFFPSESAMRLLYYFPGETGALVARRLARETGDEPSLRHDHTAFLKAVVWSDHPAVRQGALKIFHETADPGIFLLCLPAVDEKDNDLVLQRVLALLGALPAEPDEFGDGPYGDGYRLLLAAGERLGSASKPTYLHYMKTPTLRRRIALCSAIRARPEWAVEFMTPLLDDTREEKRWYGVEDRRDSERLAIRVCDDAAQAISLSRPDLPFVLRGTHEDLDRQIAKMKELIAKTSVARPGDVPPKKLPRGAKIRAGGGRKADGKAAGG